MMKRLGLLVCVFVLSSSLGMSLELSTAIAQTTRQLKLEGVTPNAVALIKKRFPDALEKGVTLAQIDQIVRYLMTLKTFSNIEVVERSNGDARELVLQASLVRRIASINISGHKRISEDELLKILGLAKNETFERKDLVAAADQLQTVYAEMGYLNARIEIDFKLPNERDVDVLVIINEGLPCIVTDINFETPNEELATRAKKLSRGLIKNPISQDNILKFQKSLTDFFAQNRFLTARLSAPAITYNKDRSEAKLTYLIESAYRYEFIFEGNVFFEDGSIIRRIELDKLFGLTTSPAADLGDRIRKLYQNQGYANVEVSYRERIFEESQKYQIKFSIIESPRVRIKNVEIAGNISRPAKYYSKFIIAHGSELVQRGFYNRKDFETGYENLAIDLQNQGFLKARIQSVRTEYTKERDFVTVVITIDEGPLTQARTITFEGAAAIPPNQLAQVISVKAKAPLSLKDVEASIARLKDFYRSEGYLDMKLLNERAYDGEDALLTYNESNTAADVRFIIHEGPKVYVGAISLDGNLFTKDVVITRELDFKVGDVLTPEKLSSSVFALQNLALFSRVNIRTLEEGTTISHRTVVVEIQERDPGLVEVGIGLTNERDAGENFFEDITYRGFARISYRNLFGTGRGIEGRVDLQYTNDPAIDFLENTMTFGYLEPYVFGGHNRGRINLTREQKVFSKSETLPVTVLIQERNSIDLLIERNLTRHLKLTHTFWGLSDQRRFDRRTHNTSDEEKIAKVGPRFELDFRDNVFNPTAGSYSFLNTEYSDPLLGSSDDSEKTDIPIADKKIIQFAKVNAGTTHYIRLKGPRWVFATSVRGGYVSNLSDKPGSGVPVTETFALGGRTTIRGFDSSDVERIPNYLQLIPNATKSDEISGFKASLDSYFYLLKTELRFPIVGDLGGAIFYDGGAVLVSQSDVRIDDPYRDSWGFGFRYETPIGPVNLEVGFKLDRKDWSSVNPAAKKESEKAIHFSIGTF